MLGLGSILILAISACGESKVRVKATEVGTDNTTDAATNIAEVSSPGDQQLKQQLKYQQPTWRLKLQRPLLQCKLLLTLVPATQR